MALFIDPNTGKMSGAQDSGYVPFKGGSVTDYQTGGNYAPSGGGTSSITPTLSLSEAQSQAADAFSGLTSPMSLSDIRTREAEQKAASAQSVSAEYAPQIARAEQSGRRAVAGAEGLMSGSGVGAGSGAGSAQMAFLAATQADVDTRVKYVEDQKAAALKSGDLAAVQEADKAISELNAYNNDLIKAKATYALQLMSGSREQSQLDLATSKSELEAQQAKINNTLQQGQLDIQTIEALAKIPQGQEITINGTTYEGLSPKTVDPSLLIESYDDKGYLTVTNKITGETVAKSKTPVGKTKTAASSVTVNMPSYGSSINKVVGADGKTVVGYVRFDSKSNQVIKQDVNGKTITEFPAGSVIGEPAKDDGGWGVN